MKRSLFLLWSFFVFLIPILGVAQSPSSYQVAIMPFIGEAGNLNTRLRNIVIATIQKLSDNLEPVAQNFPHGTSTEVIPPDRVPSLSMSGGRPYAITGKVTSQQGEQHLQIWLWDLRQNSLTYTDELVFRNINEAEELMGFLMEWVLAFLPESVVTAAVTPSSTEQSQAAPYGENVSIGENEENPEKENKWVYLGGHAGSSIRQYLAPGNTDAVPFLNKQSMLMPSFEVAVHGSVQMLPLLALQGEVMFTMDFASFPAFNYKNNSELVESIADLRYMSMLFPLLLKCTFRPDSFLVAPYGGAFYILSLGTLNITSPWEQYESESLSYNRKLPLGWIAGLNLGMKMSRFKKGLNGWLFADIRFSADIGELFFKRNPGAAGNFIEPFKRNMLSVNIGYEIGLLDRKKAANDTVPISYIRR